MKKIRKILSLTLIGFLAFGLVAPSVVGAERSLAMKGSNISKGEFQEYQIENLSLQEIYDRQNIVENITDYLQVDNHGYVTLNQSIKINLSLNSKSFSEVQDAVDSINQEIRAGNLIVNKDLTVEAGPALNGEDFGLISPMASYDYNFYGLTMTFSNQETKDLAYKIKTASNAVSIAEIFAGFFVGGLPGAAVGLLAVAVVTVNPN